ncbi:MAG: mannitol-1-phosphate 5-dehydrogenase [Erysipelotrichaceae bacterium]|nr:MAG: mannitol-1-phosphate [Erysipelotrichaceae bacterium]TXT19179.1 MAG: mannitol-1-phosphate 5-dehydrogenase [Erysipelotrichaceae bacterium]
MKQSVHFGAGNIGRGFIGLLLNESGYHVTFLDVSDLLINELKARRSYTVELVGQEVTEIKVEGVDALNSKTDLDQAQQVLMNADLITTAVGPNILPLIAKQLASVFEAKATNKVHQLVNVIACENTIGGSSQIYNALVPLLSPKAKSYLDTYVGFPNAAVDRIVPNQINVDPLWVKVEPFYEWVIDATAIKGELHIEGMHQSNKLEAYIERKLFTVNTGHAAVAYAAYQKGYATIQEAMKDESIVELVSGVLHETGALIVAKHGFKSDEQDTYIEKTLERFRNPYLSDEVSRVGRSPLRKLSSSDRFFRPFRECIDRQLPTEHLEITIANAMKYNNPDDDEAKKLQILIQQNGQRETLLEISGFSAYLKHIDAILSKL